MTAIRTVRMLAAAAALFGAPGVALAQDAISAPAVKTIGMSAKDKLIPSLAVINARGASLQGNVLTLDGVPGSSIIFADRPVRAAGHVVTKDFLKDWDDSGTFSKDPPNATISVFSADGASVKDAVVVLTNPKLDGDKLTFEVSVLEGDLTNATGAAALFIDRFGGGYRGGGGDFARGGDWGHAGYGGYRYHPAWHGAWYAHPDYGVAAGAAVGAAAVGAAAANSYYSPWYNNTNNETYPNPCGVAPYPPC